MRFGEIAQVAHVTSLENPHGAIGAAAKYQLLTEAEAVCQRHLWQEQVRSLLVGFSLGGCPVDITPLRPPSELSISPAPASR